MTTMPRKAEETFYDILKVDRKATIAEIVAAYHTAKNAFSRDSVATYSLFNNDETQSILSRLDEAYQTLSNLEKKAQYDATLAVDTDTGLPQMTEMQLKRNAERSPVTEEAPEKPLASSSPLPQYETYTGPVLAEIRERRGMSLDDVCRVTKIPKKFVTAIELEKLKDLPARVYLHGFVKNLAALYKIDSNIVTQSYLVSLDKKLEAVPKSA